MTNKIQWFGGEAKNGVTADTVLNISNGEYKDVLVMGWDNNDEFNFNYSSMTKENILWLLELARHELMRGVND